MVVGLKGNHEEKQFGAFPILTRAVAVLLSQFERHTHNPSDLKALPRVWFVE